jgi:hypothetical protein
VVEACHSWLNRFRRLLVRWERKGTNDLGFVQLAALLILSRKLRRARRAAQIVAGAFWAPGSSASCAA